MDKLNFAEAHTLSLIICLLAAAVLATGLLFAIRSARLWRARAISLEFQQRQHLQTIFALQRRLQTRHG
jgi:hypothetical protein